MTDRHTVDTITSDDLDQLYADVAQARQSAAAIAAQRDRLRQRMNALADRWQLPGHISMPDACAELRNEISCAPFDPDGAMTVQPYRDERNRPRWAFRCWGTDTCDGWLGLGHHTETSAQAERERHVAEAHTDTESGKGQPSYTQLADDLAVCQAALKELRAVARDYCPHCGRGDAAPTVTDWEQQKQRADQADADRKEWEDTAYRHAQHWRSAEATLARIAKLADEHPAGIDTALIHEALDQAVSEPAATKATEPS